MVRLDLMEMRDQRILRGYWEKLKTKVGKTIMMRKFVGFERILRVRQQEKFERKFGEKIGRKLEENWEA